MNMDMKYCILKPSTKRMAKFKSIVHLLLLHQLLHLHLHLHKHLRVLIRKLHLEHLRILLHKLHHKPLLSHQLKHKPQLLLFLLPRHLPQVRHPHKHLQLHYHLHHLQQIHPVQQIHHVDVQVDIHIILEENGVKNLRHVSIVMRV